MSLLPFQTEKRILSGMSNIAHIKYPVKEVFEIFWKRYLTYPLHPYLPIDPENDFIKARPSPIFGIKTNSSISKAKKVFKHVK